VILVLLYGQSRIFATMANDGLLPPVFARVHPRLGTPWISQLIIGVGVAIVARDHADRHAGQSWWGRARCSPSSWSASPSSICGAPSPHAAPFRTPGVPWLPLLGILSCLGLLAGSASIPGYGSASGSRSDW
jgi:APA family basic amino acid/polyamine antiporter